MGWTHNGECWVQDVCSALCSAVSDGCVISILWQEEMRNLLIYMNVTNILSYRYRRIEHVRRLCLCNRLLVVSRFTALYFPHLMSCSKTDEIAKRIAMLTVAGQVGNMFAGVMMAAIHTSMEGLSGLSGWQWVFIIDGVITLPIAGFGFFFFPDIPESTTAFYLNAEERRLALARLPPKKKDGHNIAPWSLAKRVFGAPILYVKISLFMIWT